MSSISEPAGNTQVTTPVPPQAVRLEFWVDTCREITQMQAASSQTIALYQKHGCRFLEPTHSQVQQVLQALDGALPEWEKEHSELFYQTLELNFPELVRRV